MSSETSGWDASLVLHWPHDRFALGWEYIGPTKQFPASTITIFIFIVTININIYK